MDGCLLFGSFSDQTCQKWFAKICDGVYFAPQDHLRLTFKALTENDQLYPLRKIPNFYKIPESNTEDDWLLIFFGGGYVSLPHKTKETVGYFCLETYQTLWVISCFYTKI